MARQKNKKNLVSSLALLLIVLIGGALAYKQLYLGSRLTRTLPEAALTAGLATCVQENIANQLPAELQADNNDNSLGNLFGGLIRELAGSTISSQIKHNYITDVRVAQVDDFFAKNAQLQVQGDLDILLEVPLSGSHKIKKSYQLILVKRDQNYFFQDPQFQDPNATEWQTWSCNQPLDKLP